MSAQVLNDTDFRQLMGALATEPAESLARQMAVLARAAAQSCCTAIVEFFLARVVDQVERCQGVPSCGMNADLGWVYERLATRAQEAGDLVKAEEYYGKAIDLYKSNHSDPAQAAAVLRKLADLLEKQERLPEVEDLRRRAVELDEIACGVEQTIRDLSELADLMREEQRYVEAEELYKQALELCYLAWGERDARSFNLLDYYASCRIRQGFEQDWRDLENYRTCLARGDHGAMFAVRPTHLLPHFEENDRIMLREKLRQMQDRAAGKTEAAPAKSEGHGHGHK